MVGALLCAAGAAQRRWLVAEALADGGGVRSRHGLSWLVGPTPRPRVSVPPADLAGLDLAAAADAVVHCAHRHRAREVGWWSVPPEPPAGLEVRLLARGFEIGWQPHWMHLPPDREPAARPEPAGVTVAPLDTVPDDVVEELSSFAPGAAVARQRMGGTGQGAVRHFGAWLRDRPVGQVSVLLADRPARPAGLFDLLVLPAARRRGVGAALTAAACRLAAGQGAAGMVLNATPLGELLYRALGFHSLGRGRTWWLSRYALAAGRPPAPARVAAAEHVAGGDLGALADDLRAGRLDPAAPLPNGLSPTALATLTGQPEVVRELVDRGAPLHPLDAWRLGWRDAAVRLLDRDPGVPVPGRPGATVLHVAVQLDDEALVRAALAAGVDPGARDGEYGATALGWAEHLGRPGLAALLAAMPGGPGQ